MAGPAVTKRSSQKCYLQVEISSVYTDFLGLIKLDGPDGEQLFDDLTCLESDAVEDAELVGLATPGTIKFEGYFDPQNTVQQMIVSQVTGTAGHKNFKVTDKIGSGTAVTAFTGAFKNFTVVRETKKFSKVAGEIKLRTPAALTPAS